VGRRGQGEGSIYQRKDGLWVGALELGWENGKRNRKFVHASTRRAVVSELAELKRRLGLGQRIDRDEQTVKEFLTRWLAWKEGHVRARTLDGYKGYIERHIYPALGKSPLVALRVEDVQGMLDKRKGTMAPQSVKKLRDILRNALNDAVRWGEVERNVAALARIPRQEYKRVEALTSKQAAALLKQVEGDRLEALYILSLATGLRRSEVLGLRWEDIDLEERTLEVRRGLHRAPG
jgi:integrase